MRIFDIVGGKVILNPYLLQVPEFKKIWDRDKSKMKDKANMEISYIVFLYDYNSPYQVYPERDREQRVLEDFIKDPKWKADDIIKDAVKKFKEFQDTPSLRLLESTKLALDKIDQYFREIATPEDIDKIVKNAKELGNLVASLDKLEKQVQRERLEDSKVRGQSVVGLYELPN